MNDATFAAGWSLAIAVGFIFGMAACNALGLLHPSTDLE